MNTDICSISQVLWPYDDLQLRCKPATFFQLLENVVFLTCVKLNNVEGNGSKDGSANMSRLRRKYVRTRP